MITIFDKTQEELRELRLCISCSCGKDSVGTAIICHDRGIPIHSIVRYTNDADWSCMDVVWNQLKELYADTETEFVVLEGKPLLEQFLEKDHFYKLNGTFNYGIVPCGFFNRYGTTDKVSLLDSFAADYNLTYVIGIAADEDRDLEYNKSYPLVELGYSERLALDICYEQGFYWEEPTKFGFSIRMYDFCDRLSCKYCSFSSAKQLALIYVCFPEVWEELEFIQKCSDVPFKPWGSIFNMPLKLKNEIDSVRSRLGVI